MVPTESICRGQNKYDQKFKFDFGRVENIVEKGENVGHQHFLLFPKCFQKASFSRSLKVRIVVVKI